MGVSVPELIRELRTVVTLNEVLTVNGLQERAKLLQQRHDADIELKSLGSSREGRPILSLILGEGEKTALWYGFPHANEPFGGTTVLTLVRFLLEHPLGKKLLDEWRWILIPCIDPDGALLNEPWIAAYPDLLSYMKSAHRGMPMDQVEWTFPIDHPLKQFNKSLPETKILMDLFKQDVTYLHSIHGNAFYGLYGYTSRYHPQMAEIFNQVAETVMPAAFIPLQPEFDFIKRHAPGIFSSYSLEDVLEHGKDPSDVPSDVGECAWGYFLKHHDGEAFISEVPMMHDVLLSTNDDKQTLPVAKKRYYKYWQEKFQETEPLLRKLWEDVKHQVPDSRVKRIQDGFIADISQMSKPDEKNHSSPEDSSLLPFQEYRFSQLYYFRKIMNVYHNFQWFLQRYPDLSLEENDWNCLERAIKRLEVEVSLTLLGLQFFEVSQIVRVQLTLGLAYQLLLAREG